MLSLRVYLLNGKHIDVELKVSKADAGAKGAAEDLVLIGVWANERGEDVFYPPSQISMVRVMKGK